MKFKNCIYIIAIFFLEWLIIHAEGDFAGKGLGLLFNCSLALQIGHFSIFVIQLLFASHLFDYYYNKDGILYVIRSGSRQYFGSKKLLYLFIKACFIKCVEIISYIFWCKLYGTDIELKSIGFSFLFSVFTLSILLIWESVIELKYHPEIAVFILAILYLVMTIIGDTIHFWADLYNYPYLDYIAMILFSNFLYYDRVSQNLVLSQQFVMLFLILVNMISCVVILKVIKHHDMLRNE